MHLKLNEFHLVGDPLLRLNLIPNAVKESPEISGESSAFRVPRNPGRQRGPGHTIEHSPHMFSKRWPFDKQGPLILPTAGSCGSENRCDGEEAY